MFRICSHFRERTLEPHADRQQADAIEEEIDALIAEFGSARAAIRALLHDLGVLASDMNASTSRGYTRSKVVEIRSFRRPKA